MSDTTSRDSATPGDRAENTAARNYPVPMLMVSGFVKRTSAVIAYRITTGGRMIALSRCWYRGAEYVSLAWTDEDGKEYHSSFYFPEASSASAKTQCTQPVRLIHGACDALLHLWENKLMLKFRASRQLDAIKNVCASSQAGIFKRIDENRELMELLQREAPDFLRKYPEVRSWLDSQDTFLCDLEKVAEVARTHRGMQYPRPWPGTKVSR